MRSCCTFRSLSTAVCLLMRSNRAALVIANTRRHREEQRTRTDLETLVNTTPGAG